MTDEEQLNKVFNLLGNVIDPKTDEVSPNVSKGSSKILIKLQNYIIGELRAFLKDAGFWEKISFWLFIVSAIGFLVFAIIIRIVKAFKIHPSDVVILLTATLLLVSSLSSFLFISFNTYRQTKKSKGFIRRKIQGLTAPDSLEQQQILVQLQEIEPELLKEAEYRFNLFIEQSQGAAQSASNLMPILVVIFIIFFVYSGFSLQPLDNLLSRSEKGLPGVFAIILYITKFISDSNLQTRLLKYKKYLSLLKRAQLKKRH